VGKPWLYIHLTDQLAQPRKMMPFVEAEVGLSSPSPSSLRGNSDWLKLSIWRSSSSHCLFLSQEYLKGVFSSGKFFNAVTALKSPAVINAISLDVTSKSGGKVSGFLTTWIVVPVHHSCNCSIGWSLYPLLMPVVIGTFDNI